jgi:predicted MPP superfamily phosphohydrolase
MPEPIKRKRRWYPGREEGPFHHALVAFNRVEDIPPAVLGLGLALLAAVSAALLRALGVPMGSALAAAITALLGIAGDWAMLIRLPRAGRSYGPVQPQLVLLAVFRILISGTLGMAPLAGLPEPWSWLALATAQLAGTLLAIRAFWIEPQRLSVTGQSLPTPKLSSNGRGLRLLHLADIHMERLTKRDREVIRQARSLQPDVIVFTGDFLNLSYTREPAAWAEVRNMLAEFAAPLGFYAVSGSPAVDPPDVVARLVEGLNLRWLQDECVTLRADGQVFNLIGLTCTHDPEEDAPRLEQIMNRAGRDRFTVLLYHSPDLAPEAARLGVDLQLSGHTHGGQVRLPLYGALFAASLYGKRFEMGLRRVDGLRLYVSRGIGMEGKGAPRVRFLCPPEIVLFELKHGRDGVNHR